MPNAMLPSPHFDLAAIDYVCFFAFLGILSLAGYFAGRGETKSSHEYFLAGNRLSWYVIGASLTAGVLSTDHLIGMAGWTVLYGVSIGMWMWSIALDITLLIFLWVPFLLASRVITIPQFLEQRFGPRIRLIFAIVTITINVFNFMAAVLYTGGLAIQQLFGWDISLAIIVLGLVAGAWAIFGGLSSVAWTDTVSAVVIAVGGISVIVMGLHMLAPHSLMDGVRLMLERNHATSGIWAEAVAHHRDMMTAAPTYNRLSVYQPSDHAAAPMLGMWLSSFSVGIWYNVMNQFVIQKVLGARDPYNARMGLVFMGILFCFATFIIIVPGLIVFALHPEILLKDWGAAQVDADRSYIGFIQTVMPIGLRGLYLAALFGAVQSVANSVLNSTATIYVMDIYKQYIKPKATDKDLVRMGVWASTITLLAGICIAIVVNELKMSIFYYMQTLNAFFAPPFAAIFMLGVLWKRTNARGAMTALIVGFMAAVALKVAPDFIVDFPRVATTILNQAILVAIISLLAGVVGSLLSAPPPPEKISEALTFSWNNKYIRVGWGERLRSKVIVWWLVLCIMTAAICIFFSPLVFK
jgi:solute:Na+ symporter, SSS family